MAAKYIPVNESSRLGSEIIQAARTARSALEQMQHLKDTMDAMKDGNDYSMVASFFGCSPENAKPLYDLMTAALSGIKSQQVNEFITQLG